MSSSGLVFNVRSENSKAEEIRKKALKCGAGSVSTRGTTNPNQKETTACFKKVADRKAFEAWALEKFKD